MNKNLNIKSSLIKSLPLAFLINLSLGLCAQQKMSDNLGTHVATKDLNMNTKSIVNAAGLLIGSASFTNPNVILDINSLSKVMVIPRITNITTLTGTIDNGSMAYDVATNKFYIRENNAWSSFGDFSLASGQVMLGNTSNRAVAVALTGEVTLSPSGITTIGNKKVTVAKLAAGAADANKVFATNNISGDPELISKNDLALPKYTLAQRAAIVSPANNMIIFNTDSRTIQVYDSTLSAWVNTGNAPSNNLPVVLTEIIASPLSPKPDTATVQGSVTNPGTIPVIARGVCWNTATGPTTSNFITTDGAGPGTFSSTLSGLRPSTKYYVRAYAVNALATVYGNEVEITTNIAGIPTIQSTAPGSNLTNNSATSGGTVINDRGAPITTRGIVWNTGGIPTLANVVDTKTNNGTGIGAFQSNLTGLLALTKYFVRAYATNSSGTSYGPQVEFTTPAASIPQVTTTEVTKSTSNITVGGTVVNSGGATVTSRGVYYSTSVTTPTSANTAQVIGSGNGIFSTTIGGLPQNTKYYLRAFAINSVGTAYGNVQEFTTNGPAVLSGNAIIASAVEETSVTLTATLTSDGGDETTTRGFVYSTTTNPVISDMKVNVGTGAGSFTTAVTGLASTTTYYFKAFATNTLGTVYGPQLTVTTKGSRIFEYNGTSQVSGASVPFAVPAGVTSINIKCYGPKGGGSFGGLGGYAEGQLNVTAGATLNIYVGGQGSVVTTAGIQNTQGGWNGGGRGYGNGVNSGGSGAGATDIRIGGTALSNRVIVAGGGGGQAMASNYYGGGDGGGEVGIDGNGGTDLNGKGGTQTTGGAMQSGYGSSQSTSSSPGTLGTGGNAGNANTFSGAGGGGYYGGGGGDAGGGGGGSGMVGKNLSYPMTNAILTQGVNNGPGRVIISW
jgi:hypothetical protein